MSKYLTNIFQSKVRIREEMRNAAYNECQQRATHVQWKRRWLFSEVLLLKWMRKTHTRHLLISCKLREWCRFKILLENIRTLCEKRELGESFEIFYCDLDTFFFKSYVLLHAKIIVQSTLFELFTWYSEKLLQVFVRSGDVLRGYTLGLVSWEKFYWKFSLLED